MEIIYDSADEDADVIFGTTTNADMEIDEVKITIVATGFEDRNAVSEPIEKTQKTLLNTSNNINTIKNRMVVGGYNGDNEDILDVPTFLRKQMD